MGSSADSDAGAENARNASTAWDRTRASGSRSAAVRLSTASRSTAAGSGPPGRPGSGSGRMDTPTHRAGAPARRVRLQQVHQEVNQLFLSVDAQRHGGIAPYPAVVVAQRRDNLLRWVPVQHRALTLVNVNSPATTVPRTAVPVGPGATARLPFGSASRDRRRGRAGAVPPWGLRPGLRQGQHGLPSGAGTPK